MQANLKDVVSSRDWVKLGKMAGEDRRVLGRILPLTYQPDGLLRWRAIEALGVAAGRIAERDPEFVKGIIRRLFWSLNDESGNIGWSAPEAIGEIVASRPDLFPEYGPNLVFLFENVEEEYFRPGILWGIGRVAEKAPRLVAEAVEFVRALLYAPSAQVRGLAAWCAGRLGAAGLAEVLTSLVDDEEAVHVYEGCVLRETTVGELAAEAIGRMR